MQVKDALARLLEGAPEPQVIERSGWLADVPADQLEDVYASFKTAFDAARDVLSQTLGVPEEPPADLRAWLEDEWDEFFATALWTWGGRTICLAAVHHDRDTPVFLELRTLTLPHD